MDESQAKIAKAVEMLKTHRVSEIAGALLNRYYRYASTSEVSFNPNVKREYEGRVASGVVLHYQEHELFIATTEFQSSCAPVAVPRSSSSSSAEGLIYFDGTLVLRVSAFRSLGHVAYTIEFSTYEFSIKLMRAGPWLGYLKTCFEKLEDEARRREALDELERDRKRASDIDLGE